MITINNYENLNSVDYAQFAQKAMDRYLYNIATDFARESIRLIKTKGEGNQTMAPIQYKLLQRIKKNLITLNL